MARLVELISRRVPLRKRGTLWWGLCPFHPDRNPSLAVYPDHYHCFACGAHGDAITWLIKKEGLGFAEAKKRLGREFVPSPKTRSDPSPPPLSWPARGVEYSETALLRERLVQSRWSDEQVVLSLWRHAPILSDDELRLLHPYAQDRVLARLRQIYPKSR